MTTSNLLFNRRVRVIITPKGGGTADVFGQSLIDGSSGLRVQFNIKKTSEAQTNKGTVKIYNLNQQHRATIENQSKKQVLTLFTGYGSADEICFKGDILTEGTGSMKDGPNWVTNIECSDGQEETEKNVSNVSLPSGVNFSTIIGTLVKNLGLPIKKITGLKEEVSNTGEVLSGNTSDLLTQYLERQDLEWFIDNGQISIKPKRRSVNDIDITVINGQTGLIGSPMRKEKGLNFKCLHNPKLEPGKLVIVTSTFKNNQQPLVNGTFVIRTANHVGDSREGEFVTDCEATEAVI